MFRRALRPSPGASFGHYEIPVSIGPLQ